MKAASEGILSTLLRAVLCCAVLCCAVLCSLFSMLIHCSSVICCSYFKSQCVICVSVAASACTLAHTSRSDAEPIAAKPAANQLLVSRCVCLSREDEAWLDIKLHCTSKGAMPSENDSAKALNPVPHLPGASDSKPSAPRAVTTKHDAVSLSDVTYDRSNARTSASAFFVRPGYVPDDAQSYCLITHCNVSKHLCQKPPG